MSKSLISKNEKKCKYSNKEVKLSNSLNEFDELDEFDDLTSYKVSKSTDKQDDVPKNWNKLRANIKARQFSKPTDTKYKRIKREIFFNNELLKERRSCLKKKNKRTGKRIYLVNSEFDEDLIVPIKKKKNENRLLANFILELNKCKSKIFNIENEMFYNEHSELYKTTHRDGKFEIENGLYLYLYIFWKKYLIK